MNKNEIITRLYEEDCVEKYGYKQLRTYTKDTRSQLVSEMWLRISELPEELLLDLYKQGWKHLTAYIRTYCIFSLSTTGETRHLQHLLTNETPYDFTKITNIEEDEED